MPVEPLPRDQLTRKLKQHLDQLPVLPSVVVQLMGLNPDADNYFDRVRKIVETEPNFSARLLIAANSAVHASRGPVATVGEALTRIGSRGASNLLLSLAVTRVFVPRDPWEKSLWRHALQVATLARALARCCKSSQLPPEEAYACGLLHDVGRFVMFELAPEQLRRIDEADWDTPQALIESERALCGLTHCDLGAMACEHWHLPETIGHVVGKHHALSRPAPQSKPEMLLALVRSADIAMFPSALPGAPSLSEAEEQVLEERVLAPMPDFLRSSVSEVRALIGQSGEEAEALCRGLGVA